MKEQEAVRQKKLEEENKRLAGCRDSKTSGSGVGDGSVRREFLSLEGHLRRFGVWSRGAAGLGAQHFWLDPANGPGSRRSRRLLRAAKALDRRTPFAWLARHRRHSKDYEKTTVSSEAITYIAIISLMSKRLATAQ